MSDLETLKAIEKEYNLLIADWYGKKDAANRAVRVVNNQPHIHTGEYDEPSYCEIGDYLLLFGQGIYKKMQSDVTYEK